MAIQWFLVTLLIGCIFGLIGTRVKFISMGPLILTIIGVTIFNVTTDRAVFLWEARVMTQVMTGAMIASRVGRRELFEMRKIIFPTVILIIGMAIYNIIVGGVVYSLSALDLATSLFASSPGGANDMAIISVEFGANPAYVAILQLLRLLLIFIIVPLVLRPVARSNFVRKRQSPAALISTDEDTASQSSEVIRNEIVKTVKPKEMDKSEIRREKMQIGVLLCFATAGGVLFTYLGVVAGGIIGSMLFGIVYCVSFGKVAYPSKLRTVIQILAGSFIGSSFTREAVASMYVLIIPLLLILSGVITVIFVLGWILHKFTKLDLLTSFLACSPGGLTEMALMSEEFGADTPKISIMHTLRVVAVIGTFPAMLSLLYRILS